MTYRALDIARYIINYSHEKKQPVSNLQLQKILYYVQAEFLVQKGEPIFHDKILNWSYGPVIENVYREFRTYGSIPIDKQDRYLDVVIDSKTSDLRLENVEFKLDFSQEDSKLMNTVIDSYLGIDPFELVEKTHNEDPWKNTRQNDIISTKDIQSYYKANKDKILK